MENVGLLGEAEAAWDVSQNTTCAGVWRVHRETPHSSLLIGPNLPNHTSFALHE